MKYVSIYDLRNNLAEIMNTIVTGNTTVIVTKHNKPVAKIEYYNEDANDDPFLKTFGMLKDDGISGKEFVNRVRRNKHERNYIKKLRNRT